MEAGYEDISWILTHMKHINKIAFVTHSKTWKWLIAIDSPFASLFGIGEKHFDTDCLSDAWAWVKEK